MIVKPVSRCLYCNSVSFGKGCRFAPKGVHFHAGDTKKCSYCGSTNFGNGCKMNPFSDLHIHGIPYNSMISETIHDNMRNKLLLNELIKDTQNYKAYTLGIIDINGNKIKEPVTEEEKASYTQLTKTILRIKRHLGSKADLIYNTSLLESASAEEYNPNTHKKLLEFKSDVKHKINDIFELIDKAMNDGLTLEQIDAIFQE
jgi:hypothetical protein